MTSRVLHVVEAGQATPDRTSLADVDDLTVAPAATRAAALDRVAAGTVDCLVGEASDPDWLFEVVAAVRDLAGPVPAVVRSEAHQPALAVACDERPAVSYFPRADERAVDVSLADQVRDRVCVDGPDQRHLALDRLRDAVAQAGAPIEDRIDAVLAAGCDYLGVEVGLLSTIDRASGHFALRAARGDHELLQPGATRPLAETYCRRVVDADGVVGVRDASVEGWEGDPAFERFGLGCYLGAPVTVGGDLYGTLCFADEASRDAPFSAEEESFLELAAGWLGAAIEREEGPAPTQSDDRRVLDRISDGFFAVDVDWSFTYVNERFEEIVGVGADELLGEELWEAFPDAAERDFYDEYHRAMETQDPVQFEEYYPPLEEWFALRAYPSESGLSVYFRAVTDRKERERELEQYRALTEAASDVILTIDADSVIRSVNPAVEDVFGYEPAELRGASLTELMTAPDGEDHLDGLDSYLATGERNLDWDYVELTGQQADGTAVPIGVSFSETTVGGERYFTGIIRDISGRKERERTLAERERVLQEMYRVVAEKGVPLEQTVDDLLAIGREALDTEYAALSRVEGEDFVFEIVHDPEGETEAGDVTPLSATNCERAIVTEETVVLGDIAEDAPELTDRAGYTEHGISSYLGTPVEIDDEIHGTFCFYDREAREEPFSDWQVTLVELMGNWIGHERERARRRRDLERYETIVETLQEPVYAIDDEWRFTLVTDQLAADLGIDRDELLGEPLERVLDEATFAECRAAIAAAGEAVELSVEGLAVRPDGEPYPTEVELTGLDADDGFAGAVGTVRDDTERKERARDLEFYYELVAGAGIGIGAIDERGTIAYANDATAELADLEADELEGTKAWELVDDVTPETFTDEWRDLDPGETSSFVSTSGDVDVEVRSTKGEIAGTPYMYGSIVDVSRRRDRERAIDALQSTAADLLAAETTTVAAECAVAAAADIIDAPVVALYEFDGDAGVLEPTAVSERSRQLLGELPSYSGGDGLLWQAFVRDEAATYVDVAEREGLSEDDASLGSVVVLPLGTHGVLAAGDVEAGPFPDQDEEFLRTLAANLEVAMDRAAGREELRRNERELAERTGRLEQLDRINAVIRRTARAVVQASTREGIETAVCERFVAVDPFEYAWVGEPGPARETVIPSEWVGEPGQPASDGPITIDDDPGAHPVGAAVATGDVQVRTDLLTEGGGDLPAWRRQALAHGYQACCAVPFDYEGVTRGVLLLYARESGAFARAVRDVLSELGAMLGYALAAVERRGARTSPGVTEVEFDAADADLPCSRFADELDCRVTFKRASATDGGAPTVTYALAGASEDDLSDALADQPGVEAARAVAVDDDTVLVDVDLAGPWFGTTVADAGGEVVAAAAGDGEASLTVRLPSGIDVRGVVESLQTALPSATVTAQRQRETPTAEPLVLSRRLDDLLTDRQYAALETAYHSGYFDRPRRATGADVADLLDISQPTFSEHLQRGQGRTFEMLFDGDGPARE